MLPRDPMILLSYVNTRLRNTGMTLSVFCAEENADEQELRKTLAGVGFEYDPARNQFV